MKITALLSLALMLLMTTAIAGEREEKSVDYELKSWPEWRLRGVNINVDSSPIQREDLRYLAENWGANHVRIQIFTAGVPLDFGEPGKSASEYFKQKLDPILEWCEEFDLSVVLDAHGGPGNPKHWSKPERLLWKDFKWHDNFARLWREIAQYYSDRRIIVAYELLNEPNMREQVKDTPSDWNALAKKLTAAIREVDTYHTIMVGPIAWSNASGFSSFEPTGDLNTIYTFHMYQPHQFTHQGVQQNSKMGISYPGMIAGQLCNKETLKEFMNPAAEFQKKYNLSRLYVGEFSAIIWAPDNSAYNYLRDLLEIFEAEGWDWAYHAYREWQGWSLEHEAADRGSIQRVGSTDRLELFKEHFAKNRTE